MRFCITLHNKEVDSKGEVSSVSNIMIIPILLLIMFKGNLKIVLQRMYIGISKDNCFLEFKFNESQSQWKSVRLLHIAYIVIHYVGNEQNILFMFELKPLFGFFEDVD